MQLEPKDNQLEQISVEQEKSQLTDEIRQKRIQTIQEFLKKYPNKNNKYTLITDNNEQNKDFLTFQYDYEKEGEIKKGKIKIDINRSNNINEELIMNNLGTRNKLTEQQQLAQAFKTAVEIFFYRRCHQNKEFAKISNYYDVFYKWIKNHQNKDIKNLVEEYNKHIEQEEKQQKQGTVDVYMNKADTKKLWDCGFWGKVACIASFGIAPLCYDTNCCGAGCCQTRD